MIMTGTPHLHLPRQRNHWRILITASIREGKCEFVGVDSSQFRFLLRFDDDDDRDGFERGDDAAIFGPWRCG
jgi:hypothetical protein